MAASRFERTLNIAAASTKEPTPGRRASRHDLRFHLGKSPGCNSAWGRAASSEIANSDPARIREMRRNQLERRARKMPVDWVRSDVDDKANDARQLPATRLSIIPAGRPPVTERLRISDTTRCLSEFHFWHLQYTSHRRRLGSAWPGKSETT